MFRGIPKQELASIALDDTQGDLVVSFRGPQPEPTVATPNFAREKSGLEKMKLNRLEKGEIPSSR